MKYKDSFSSCHPAVNFLYFAAVIGFTMCYHHPVTLIVSLLFSIIYSIYLDGSKTVRFSLVYMIPLALAAIVINPAFNHRGVTILMYLPTGNPLTLESILFGVSASVMLVSVVMWFRCYSSVMTSDKFMYLFGKIIPSLSLIISMALRFIPVFKNRFITVSEARKCSNKDSDRKLLTKIKRAIEVTSIVVTWSLENSIETSDSMKSRGFGRKGRTAYSVFRFEERDKYALIWIMTWGVFVLCGGIAGGFSYWYYPSLSGIDLNVMPVCFQVGFMLLCITPLIINAKEKTAWKNM